MHAWIIVQSLSSMAEAARVLRPAGILNYHRRDECFVHVMSALRVPRKSSPLRS